jgi:hypothetical protein
MDDPAPGPSTFSMNGARLLEGDVAHAFCDQVLAQARERGAWSDEHFTVDGMLIEAWAGQKSFTRQEAKPRAPPDELGNPRIDFRGEPRPYAIKASTTDPEACLDKRATAQAVKLASLGPLYMKNRRGLMVATRVMQAAEMAEREAVVRLACLSSRVLVPIRNKWLRLRRESRCK